MVLGGLWTLVKGAWASREPGTTSRALLESGPGGQPGRPGLRPLPGVSCSMDHRPRKTAEQSQDPKWVWAPAGDPVRPRRPMHTPMSLSPESPLFVKISACVCLPASPRPGMARLSSGGTRGRAPVWGMGPGDAGQGLPHLPTPVVPREGSFGCDHTTQLCPGHAFLLPPSLPAQGQVRAPCRAAWRVPGSPWGQKPTQTCPWASTYSPWPGAAHCAARDTALHVG